MSIRVVGIDLGKQTFHIHGVDDTGKVIVQKKRSRAKLQALMLNSMDGQGRVWDNIFIERLWRSVKY